MSYKNNRYYNTFEHLAFRAIDNFKTGDDLIHAVYNAACDCLFSDPNILGYQEIDQKKAMQFTKRWLKNNQDSIDVAARNYESHYGRPL